MITTVNPTIVMPPSFELLRYASILRLRRELYTCLRLKVEEMILAFRVLKMIWVIRFIRCGSVITASICFRDPSAAIVLPLIRSSEAARKQVFAESQARQREW